MQRKATKTTRAANAEERRFHSFCKESDCIVCGNTGPSIVHHCEGATFKHNKVLIGHWFVIPLCLECDNVITFGSRRDFRRKFGPQSTHWYNQHQKYNDSAPVEVYNAILDWGR